MNEETSWWYIFSGRWMFPFYAGIFMILGFKFENYRRRKNIDKAIEIITNRTLNHTDNDLFRGDDVSEQLMSLTNELNVIEVIKGFGILNAETQSIEFKTGDLNDIFLKNQRILRTIFNDFSQRNPKKKISLPGRTLILNNFGKDRILAINLVNTKFPFSSIKI